MVCHQDQFPVGTSVSSVTLEAVIQNGSLPLLCREFSSVNMCSHFTLVGQPAVAKLHHKISQTCLSPFKSFDSFIVPCIHCEVRSYSQSWQKNSLANNKKTPIVQERHHSCRGHKCSLPDYTAFKLQTDGKSRLVWTNDSK